MIQSADDVGKALNAFVAVLLGFVGFVVNAGLSLAVEMFFFAIVCWGLWTAVRLFVAPVETGENTTSDVPTCPVNSTW